MTCPENNKEITATAGQIRNNISNQCQLALHLSKIAREIETRLDPPETNHAGLKALASEAAAAASLTADTSDRIRYLSYQLRTLLDQEEEAGNAQE